jgi:hypothetical protein
MCSSQTTDVAQPEVVGSGRILHTVRLYDLGGTLLSLAGAKPYGEALRLN